MQEQNNQTFFLFNDEGDSIENVITVLFNEYFSKNRLKQNNYGDTDDCLRTEGDK